MRENCHVFVDFDGTIVPHDATDFLLERFAHPEWHEVEEDWRSGRIGSRECLARQTALISATPAALDAAIDELDIDSGFDYFLRICGEHGANVTIISDGYDRVIERVLRRHALSLPFVANRLVPTGADGWRLAFPHAKDDCRSLAGHCKCATAKRLAKGMRIVVGDGRSDLCVSGDADLVLAKSTLLDLCASNRIEPAAFEDFFDVGEQLAMWFEAQHGEAPELATGPLAASTT